MPRKPGLDTFSAAVKREIAANILALPAARAALASILKNIASFTLFEGRVSALTLRMQSPLVIRTVYVLFKKLYGFKNLTVANEQSTMTGRRVIELKAAGEADQIVKELGLLNERPPSRLVKGRDGKVGYLVGAFLSGGMVSSPETPHYVLEFVTHDADYASVVATFLRDVGFEPKQRFRQHNHVVYFKRSEVIADLLKLLGATKSLFVFEDKRMERDLSNQLSRLNNIDIANQQKSMSSGRRQAAMVKTLMKKPAFSHAPFIFKTFCAVRLQNPEASLKTIADLMAKKGVAITKSGVNHQVIALRTMLKSYT